jgi:hypothetical protein
MLSTHEQFVHGRMSELRSEAAHYSRCAAIQAERRGRRRAGTLSGLRRSGAGRTPLGGSPRLSDG